MIVNCLKQHMEAFKKRAVNLCQDNRGIGTVEVILILVVLIGLVVIFRDQLTTIINNIFDRIVNDTNSL